MGFAQEASGSRCPFLPRLPGELAYRCFCKLSTATSADVFGMGYAGTALAGADELRDGLRSAEALRLFLFWTAQGHRLQAEIQLMQRCETCIELSACVAKLRVVENQKCPQVIEKAPIGGSEAATGAG